MSTVTTLLTKLRTDSALPIYITEMDISTTDDNQQLQLYQQYFPLFRDSGYVKGHHHLGLDLRQDLEPVAQQRPHSQRQLAPRDDLADAAARPPNAIGRFSSPACGGARWARVRASLASRRARGRGPGSGQGLRAAPLALRG